MNMKNSTVRAVNRLTARWAEAHGGDAGTVFTAAGVWPLLAPLADGAAGPARTELAEALGMPAERAAGAARELLAALDGVRGLRAATGLWTRADLPLEAAWLERLAPGGHGTLSGDAAAGHKALDAWADRRTGGMVKHMPVTLTEGPHGTKLVLASALTLKTKWIRPFLEWPGKAAEGPWAGLPLRMLYRSTALLERAAVAQGPKGAVTLLEVVGDTGVDVHLVLGEPGAGTGGVLTTGIEAVTGARPLTPASLLPEGRPGPGLTIARELALTPEPRLVVETPAFEVRAEHDLLERARLFGLEQARDDSRGHFPGVSSEPLAIGSARQSAVARFQAEGFEAAAVTAVAAAPGCAAPPRLRYRTRRAEVRFDRPFGFLAVHRTSRLVLAAGWVTDPLPYARPAEKSLEEKLREEAEAWAEEEVWAEGEARAGGE
ncbi:serpin (serine protease inhibitor) [Streptomyces sp. 3211.6]|uniref:serpin family protein n=1 Tax=Streptomyces sp. 3211.6 TaxID=1938845 RepID=UPI000F1E7E1E|nr:serpin family protein [Streptomyces sp. 3211.6]RKT02722.1 serpin (serine protease inhibitor) [Streptomyces sp. 3211.6]